MAEINTNTSEEQVALREYECAYLLMPTIAEEKVADEVEAIRSVVEKNSTSIVKEKQPERIELAYEMTIRRESKRDRFTEAYFGWMTFETSSDKIEEIQDKLSLNTALIRYMIINASADQEEEVDDELLVSPQSEEDQAKLGDDTSDEDIDKSIDALVDEKEAVTTS